MKDYIARDKKLWKRKHGQLMHGKGLKRVYIDLGWRRKSHHET